LGFYYYLTFSLPDDRKTYKPQNPHTLMARKSTSIRVDEGLWKEVKKHCIDANLEIYEYVEQLVREDLQMKRTKGKR